MKKIVALSVACLALVVLPAAASGPGSEGGSQDAVVVAVIDNAFNPYHFDFRASLMPQALDAEPGNDLPLDRAPHEWLPGFPDPAEAFASYDALRLSLPPEPTARMSTLQPQDAAEWGQVQRSTPEAIHYSWVPGSKIIGALEFGAGDQPIYGDQTAHGTGTTSVAVGNIHGTCPECLLVFLGYGSSGEAQDVLNWAHAQPWIDVVSNSYGINTMAPVNSIPQVSSRGVTIRDQIYAGPVDGQRSASERGQTIVFSAGNGVENGYIVPHSTYTSSVKGPDWVITVGAIDSVAPHPAYLGAGKPVDAAGIGDSYPSAYGSRSVGGSTSTFSGTSNASPTVAGTYARALYVARTDLAGASRVQQGGIVASGAPYACGEARPDCELGDGILTAEELRTRVLHAPARTTGGTSPGGLAAVAPVGEETILAQGHGVFFARLKKDASWLAEHDRVIGPMEGRLAAPERSQDERNFMVVDSFCRQQIWGGWSGGYWKPGTQLPAPDPAFPVRSALAAACSARPA